jgi:hypothetical protein
MNSGVIFSAITRKITPGKAKYMGRGFEIFKPADIVSPGRAFLLLVLIRDHHHFPSFCTIPCDIKKGTPQTGVNTLKTSEMDAHDDPSRVGLSVAAIK